MNTSKRQITNYVNLNNRIQISRGQTFGFIIVGALIAFEIFNYSTTEFALVDLLGNLSFLGFSWATILAIAFCGIDFAGIARLHIPSEQSNRTNETWYLFGAWLLAATMNAMLTWWGVSLAIVNHDTLGNSIVDRQTLLTVVPIFVAVLVWLIRILIISTYSLAGTRLLNQQEIRSAIGNRTALDSRTSHAGNTRSLGNVPLNQPTSSSAYRTSARSQNEYNEPSYNRPDPVYTPVQSAAPNHQAANETIDNPYSSKTGVIRRS